MPFFFFYIGIQLLYNIVLISAVQQSKSVMHTHIHSFFCKIGISPPTLRAGSKRDTDVQNRLLDSVGEGEGGII